MSQQRLWYRTCTFQVVSKQTLVNFKLNNQICRFSGISYGQFESVIFIVQATKWELMVYTRTHAHTHTHTTHTHNTHTGSLSHDISTRPRNVSYKEE